MTPLFLSVALLELPENLLELPENCFHHKHHRSPPSSYAYNSEALKRGCLITFIVIAQGSPSFSPNDDPPLAPLVIALAR